MSSQLMCSLVVGETDLLVFTSKFVLSTKDFFYSIPKKQGCVEGDLENVTK